MDGGGGTLNKKGSEMTNLPCGSAKGSDSGMIKTTPNPATCRVFSLYCLADVGMPRRKLRSCIRSTFFVLTTEWNRVMDLSFFFFYFC